MDYGSHEAQHHHGSKSLPSILAAPEFLAAWRVRSLGIAVVLALVSLMFLFMPQGREHVLRAYLMGVMTSFNFVGGSLAFLLVQYLSGGKWGLILRRPLEAATRTWWVVAVLMLPILLLMKNLYQWAAFHTVEATLAAYKQGILTHEQQLCINAKHTMLSPVSAWVQYLIVMGFMGLVITLLNRFSMSREADPEAGTMRSYDRWRILFENISGPSILLYVVVMTDFVIVFVKSLDVTWYSSIYGLQFLVAQGYGVLALGMITLLLLSRYEPMKTMFRTTEQHDLGKLTFAFVMLNIYFTFAEFLIIYSGNLPDEIPWYLHRIRGGWWTITSLDALCHWVIPFCLLLSREFKRSRSRMFALCIFMIVARLIDMFWLIEPNFKGAAENLHLAGNFSIFAYLTVPLAVLFFWATFYLTELGRRPLIAMNDPHTAEVLEPEHAH